MLEHAHPETHTWRERITLSVGHKQMVFHKVFGHADARVFDSQAYLDLRIISVVFGLQLNNYITSLSELQSIANEVHHHAGNSAR